MVGRFHDAGGKRLLGKEDTFLLMRQFRQFLALPVLSGLKKRMDPDRYNGASLVGLRGIVVKSHGGTSEQGFLSALEVAEVEARRNVPALISDALAPAATAGQDH